MTRFVESDNTTQFDWNSPLSSHFAIWTGFEIPFCSVVPEASSHQCIPPPQCGHFSGPSLPTTGPATDFKNILPSFACTPSICVAMVHTVRDIIFKSLSFCGYAWIGASTCRKMLIKKMTKIVATTMILTAFGHIVSSRKQTFRSQFCTVNSLSLINQITIKMATMYSHGQYSSTTDNSKW